MTSRRTTRGRGRRINATLRDVDEIRRRWEAIQMSDDEESLPDEDIDWLLDKVEEMEQWRKNLVHQIETLRRIQYS